MKWDPKSYEKGYWARFPEYLQKDPNGPCGYSIDESAPQRVRESFEIWAGLREYVPGRWPIDLKADAERLDERSKASNRSII